MAYSAGWVAAQMPQSMYYKCFGCFQTSAHHSIALSSSSYSFCLNFEKLFYKLINSLAFKVSHS